MADPTEQTWPRAVTRYETSDGKVHRSECAATEWQRAIVAARLATAALEQGEFLADAIALYYREAYGRDAPAEYIARLAGVTHRSQLVISYWQCRDTAGYRPRRINPDGSIWVYGDAGSWSGPYGNDMTVRELADYVEDTRKRLGRIPEAA